MDERKENRIKREKENQKQDISGTGKRKRTEKGKKIIKKRKKGMAEEVWPVACEEE